MKKALFLIVAALSFTLSSNAQTENAAATSSRKGLWVRPDFFVGGGKLAGADLAFSPLYLNPRFTIALGGSVDVGYMFNDKIGLFGGIGIGGYRYDCNDTYYPAEMDLIGSNVYFEIPMYFRFISSHAGHTGFFLDAGFKHQMLLGCKTRIKVQNLSTGQSVDQTENGNDNNIYNAYSFSPLLHLGVNINCGSVVELNVGPEFSFQATKLFDPSEKDSNGNYMNGHYFNIALKIGVGFKCTK